GRLLGQFSALQSFSSDGVPHLTAQSLISDVAQHNALRSCSATSLPPKRDRKKKEDTISKGSCGRRQEPSK
ncbi:hypothetical protein Tco_1196912, partial [Tanacetum coccineum]